MRSGASTRDRWIWMTAAVLLAATIALELVVPLGYAVWLAYFLAVGVTVFQRSARVPFIVAASACMLLIVGYNVAPASSNSAFSFVNRTLGGSAFLMIALIVSRAIHARRQAMRALWLQEAENAVAMGLRGDLGPEQIAEAAATRLAAQLDADVAAVYRLDGGRLQLTGGIALPAGMPASLALQEGLAGQVARDERIRHLHGDDAAVLELQTSLGRLPVRERILAPIHSDGAVVGVIELGRARAGGQQDLDRELLERCAETIGMALRASLLRAQLVVLLEESQRQGEELQAQQEELRVANEELEEQSRSLLQSQSHLEEQQAELEQSNVQLEERTHELEAQKQALLVAQAQLVRNSNELAATSRYKSEFLANMSHELRTPLNSLLIMARLLADNREGNLTLDQVKFAETIETSGNDLLVLINDVLDISKIEAGHVDLNVRRVRIAPILNKMTSAFEASAAEKGLVLRTEFKDDLPAEIETDAQRLEQVLRNFLSNAVKFTEKGEIVLYAGRQADGRLTFTVRDTGAGISPDQHDIIFEAFRQADGTISRKHGGTGLGLSISRELARLLGGDIKLESAVGQGSAFSLVLPETYSALPAEPPSTQATSPLSRAAQAPGHGQSSAVAQPGKRPEPQRQRAFEDDREKLTGDSRIILVVEDDPAFARILYDLAHEVGFACLHAETADEGVVLARQFLPHAVILDIGLPDHTGLSVLDRLKRDVRTRHIPVHIVSVSDYAHTARSYGAAGYMLKPVKRDELIRVLEGLEAQFSQRMRRVLIVEDDVNQLESLQRLLATRDVETLHARSAAECLDKLSSGIFDCMVLDLKLPDKSGLDLLEQLSLDEAVSFPPVIVYTGKELSSDEELRLRKYSKSIIIKGARSPERLLDEVTLFLHQVVSELPDLQRNMLAKSLSRDSTLEGRQILVVEDDIRNVYALTSILEPHGATVRIARNGIEALRALEQASQPDARRIDLVLMDVMMPEMDGLTAMREIRRRSEWKSLPIIALTAKAMAHDQEQCLAAGANDYLAKPLDVDKLLSLVRVWIPR